MKLDDDQETILALKAIINKGEKSERKKSKKDTKKKFKAGGKENKEKPKWKTMSPKFGEPTTKLNNGKTYHWCPNHNKWTIHYATECQGLKKYVTPTPSVSSNQEENKKKKSKQELKMKVLQTLAEMSSGSKSCTSP